MRISSLLVLLEVVQPVVVLVIKRVIGVAWIKTVLHLPGIRDAVAVIICVEVVADTIAIGIAELGVVLREGVGVIAEAITIGVDALIGVIRESVALVGYTVAINIRDRKS